MVTVIFHPPIQVNQALRILHQAHLNHYTHHQIIQIWQALRMQVRHITLGMQVQARQVDQTNIRLLLMIGGLQFGREKNWQRWMLKQKLKIRVSMQLRLTSFMK